MSVGPRPAALAEHDHDQDSGAIEAPWVDHLQSPLPVRAVGTQADDPQVRSELRERTS